MIVIISGNELYLFLLRYQEGKCKHLSLTQKIVRNVSLETTLTLSSMLNLASGHGNNVTPAKFYAWVVSMAFGLDQNSHDHATES